MKKTLTAVTISLLSAAMLLSCAACKPVSPDTQPPLVNVPGSGNQFDDKDKNPSQGNSNAVRIQLNGNSATCDSSKVSISGGNIEIKQSGTYDVRGTLNNGTIVVAVNKQSDVNILLQDVTIRNDHAAAIYIQSCDHAYLNLKGTNTLTVSDTISAVGEENVDGVVYAKDDLTVHGNGSLFVNSAKGHGIVGKDDVIFVGGTVNIVAEKDAIDANDSVRISQTALTCQAKKNGISVENKKDETRGYFYAEESTLDITADQAAVTASGTGQIASGTFRLKAGEKGIETQKDLLLSGGTTTIDSADDGLHSASSVQISGGLHTISTGDDGIHADQSLYVTGGSVTVLKCNEGLEAEHVSISGGTLSVTAANDGINAATATDSKTSRCSITISGGNIYVNADGDGIDVNGTLTVSGGMTVIQGPSDNRNGAIDFDTEGTVTGGILIAIGASGMAQNFTAAEQGSILVRSISPAREAGTQITLTENGNELISVKAEKPFSSVLITAPSLQRGGAYGFAAGDYSVMITLSELIHTEGTGGWAHNF